MPQIPTFDSIMPVPTNPVGPRVDPNFYGQAGQALQRGAAQIGNVADEFNQRYQDAARQTDAANMVADASKQLGDAQFKWSKVANRDEAYQGFQADAARIKTQTLDGINDPLVKAHVTSRVDMESITRGLETQNEAFKLEASKWRGDLDQSLTNYAQAAATAGSQQTRDLILGNAEAAIKTAVDGHYLTPEDGELQKISFRSKMAEVQVRRDMNEDPDAAATKLADPNEYAGLLPEKREIFQHTALVRADMIERRAIAAQAHADLMAERAQRQAQAFNFSQDFAAALGGNGPNPSQVADKVRTQAYSPEAANAILTARNGRDDPMATVQLWKHVGDGAAAPDDIYTALSAGKVSGPTGSDMMKALTARNRGGENQVERAAFATLRTALGGDAVDKGLVDYGNAEHVKQALGWAQAQGEWTRRVLAGTEDPQAVLADMVNRYQRPDHPPVNWDRPRLGGVYATKDVGDIWAKTVAAHDTGQMPDDQFNAQAALLNQYRKFFADQDARRAAAAGVRSAPANGQKNSAAGGGN